MPLSKEEREFLDAYVFEVMNEPFNGPAASDLRQRDVYYTDIHWILTAWDRERSAERRLYPTQPNPNPPPSPWATLEEAKRRNDELRREWEPRIRGKPKAAVEEHVA